MSSILVVTYSSNLNGDLKPMAAEILYAAMYANSFFFFSAINLEKLRYYQKDGWVNSGSKGRVMPRGQPHRVPV